MWSVLGTTFYSFPSWLFGSGIRKGLARWFISGLCYQRGPQGLKDLLPKLLLHSRVWCSGSLTSLLPWCLTWYQTFWDFSMWLRILIEWWPHSSWTSYTAAAHGFKRPRRKLPEHLWLGLEIVIMSLPSYSTGESGYRKAQIQGKGSHLDGRSANKFVAIFYPPQSDIVKIILSPLNCISTVMII